MKRFLAMLLCTGMLLCLFSGCAQENAPHTPTGDGLTWDDDASHPTEEVDADLQELTLVYYPERSLNPLISTDFTNRALFSLLYQGLFAVDRNYNVTPILCKSYSRSEDMRTYTFYLNDATFSDGARLTVDDVVATFNAASESGFYRGRFLHVVDISASWDGGVTIRLNTASENLPLLLDVPILQASQLEAEHPAGTGPYLMEDSTSGPRLRRRSDWWCQADLAVTARSIPLTVAQSPAQIRDAFEFFDVGLVCADPGSDSYADYRCDYELWDSESGIFLFLACNLRSEVFSDPELRAALTYAIDRDTLSESYYRGYARSASLPASPQSPYYNENLAAQYAYDPIKFAQAVSANGFQNSEVSLLVNMDDSLRLRAARAIAKMLNECGLSVTVVEASGTDYTYRLNAWDYDLYLGQTKLSPNMDLTPFFNGYGSMNHGGISDPTIYALCLDALANIGNYYNLHQTIMNDGRLCPILFRSYAVYATRGLLTGLTPSRDNVFYYSLGRSMEDALVAEAGPEPTLPEPEPDPIPEA